MATVHPGSTRASSYSAPVPAAPRRTGLFGRAWLSDVIGVVWVLGAGVVAVAPLLHGGVFFGPFDQLARSGLTATGGSHTHYTQSEDLILQFAPWSTLAWHQVHAGHLPLWNPYNVLGMPLAFNWQSAVFSPPNLVSYLFPVQYAYTAIVVTKLVVAGTGVYVLCRVLGLRSLAATFGATSFELCGPMLERYGWAMTGVTMWLGWLVAFIVLALRGRSPRRNGALLAVTVAMMFTGGHPESMVVVAVCLVVFLAVMVVQGGTGSKRADWRPLVRLGVAGVAGAALAAPLLLPGWQLASQSARRGGTGEGSLPLGRLANVFVSGLQGQNVAAVAYVGAVALALAAAVLWVRRRERDVIAFAAVAVVAALLTFTPLYSALDVIPGGRLVTWNRTVMVLAFAVSVLGAAGLQALEDTERFRSAARVAAAALVLSGLVLVLVVVFRHAPSAYIHQHLAGLVAAFATTVGALIVVLALRALGSGATPRWRARAGAGLLAAETAFLLAAAVPSWQTGDRFFPETPAVHELRQAIGGATVGVGDCRSIGFAAPATVNLGISADANAAYAVHEFSVYDVMVPRAYGASWHQVSGHPLSSVNFSLLGIFCPAITTVEEAQLYGVQYLLEPSGTAGPDGTRFVRSLGDEDLYAVPDSWAATAVALDPGTPVRSVPDDATGSPVAVSHPGPASWRLRVDAAAPELLRLRVTGVPGWHATIGGRPLALERWAHGAMLEAKVPPGHWVVELSYWPTAFSAGIVVALVTLAVLVGTGVAGIAGSWRRRRRRAAGEP